MKKILKFSFIILLMIFQLFPLNVGAYKEEQSDIVYEDIFKFINKDKTFSLESNLIKIACKYGLVRGLNKKIINPITVTTIGYELVLLKNNYSTQPSSSTYIEEILISEDILEDIDMLEDIGTLEEIDMLEEIITDEFDETEKILALVKDSTIYAEVIEDADYYQYYGSGFIGTFLKGTTVEILRDYNREWYRVKLEDKIGWVRAASLNIPEDPKTNTDKMTKEEIEFFVNHTELSSDTHYLVWVDIDRQLTHVFLGTKGKWGLHKTIICATGRNKAPTIRGTYKIQDRGTWFYSQRLGGGAKYWVRFYGDYLIHTVAMDANQNIVDNTLGKRASSGCIRFSLEDSEWFYSYVPQGTTVYIN